MFKCFKFIDDMMKQLNEADEMPMEDDAEMGGDEAAMEDPAAEGDMGEDNVETQGGASEAPQDPSQIADVGAGDFVSPIAKANWANFMLKFLRDNKPDIMIPTEYETVTTDNADQIIDFIKNAGMLSNDEFGNALNNI